MSALLLPAGPLATENDLLTELALQQLFHQKCISLHQQAFHQHFDIEVLAHAPVLLGKLPADQRALWDLSLVAMVVGYHVLVESRMKPTML